MTARRMLITGATGGLGQALVRAALERGDRVRATGRSAERGARFAGTGAHFIPLDLVEADDRSLRQLVGGCDTIIHAAALSASWGPAENFERANVVVTQRLIDLARQSDCRRFVYISSPSIFATFKDRLLIGPQDAPADPPLNAYARTKLAAERLVIAANDDHLACCALRPRALVGEGDEVILPRLAQLARRRAMPLPGGGRALIELTDLRDAADAVMLAEDAAPQIAGEAINISGGVPASVRDIATSLARALGCAPKLVHLPRGLARVMATGMEGTARLLNRPGEPVLTRYTLATLGYSQTFDPEPARRLIGYAPRHDALATLIEDAQRRAAMGEL
ncbi:NAD-dependent epimerase/dehydratase family protein [Altererythrobacter xixiisoli]|uniref:NAD-dependent epimerase/dehydratase family protein n=1 Tax=Croceibacterium xixiisoli TaxID=1476466 RepID=A0A6I4TTQ8_9SPHN|nr:NAD-dependent epimerase/dehydratase family protein [Croceibacterium xixiisoli]MXO97938.1 NAD-dependent epimerase/dehydratase family protein [Croceibacterium xixiisoli]